MSKTKENQRSGAADETPLAHLEGAAVTNAEDLSDGSLAQPSQPGRRDVLALGGATALGAAGIMAVASPAVVKAQSAVTWHMATPWPRHTPGLYTASQRLAKSITSMSGGRLTIVPHFSGSKVPAERIVNAVSQGVVQMGHSTSQNWRDQNPALQYFSGLPFGMTAVEHAGWINFGGGQALWDQAYGTFGIKPFLAGNTGPQAGGWFRREIRSVNDLKGLKMRIEGIGADVLKLLGVVPTSLPPSDIYPAMQSGKLDAVDWVGPWNDLAFGFHKLARFYYIPSFHELSSALELIVNAKAYAALPGDLREIVRIAAHAETNLMLADFTYHNAQAMGLLETKTNAVVGPFPDKVVRVLGEASHQVVEELGASSRMARAIHISYFDYLTQAIAYARAVQVPALTQREANQK